MILLYRLLLNLGEASNEDIYIGSQYLSSVENDWHPKASEVLALSSLRFECPSGTANDGRGMF